MHTPSANPNATPSAAIRSANALLVFEAAARCLSFTRAAAELHVTQVAVSRMVGRLEGSLGTALFIRSRAGLTLTEDGMTLYMATSAGFGQMQAAIRELKRRRTDNDTVTLSLSSGFTSHWLMPRYEKFQRTFPHINLRFQLISGVLQGEVEEEDMGLRMHMPGHTRQSWSFCPEMLLPICSPDYLARVGSLDDASELKRHTLIHLSQTTMNWSDFSARHGMDLSKPGNAISFSDSALVLQAAMLGQGVALGWVSAVSYALRKGQLVPAFSRLVRTGREYRMVARSGPVRPEVMQVKDWLVAEMEEDIKAIELQYPFFAAATTPGQ